MRQGDRSQGQPMQSEHWWDKKLHIDTCGREAFLTDPDCNGYEPTDYCVLERLAQSGCLTPESKLLDYGCGKGRCLLFLAAMTGCSAVGVEISEHLLQKARENLRTSRLPQDYKDRIKLLHIDARLYEPQDEDTIFFFNPFSEEIFKVVLGRIRQSYYENPRPIRLFLYYPEDAFVALLMAEREILFVDEIDCTDLFPEGSRRERLLIFEYA